MSLQIWLPLTKDLSNQGVSSLVNASVQSGCSLSSDGKLGGCYKNTGTNANVAVPISFSSDCFSLCAWVRVDTRRNNWCRSFGLSGNGTYMGLGCEHTNGTSLGFHYYKTIDGTNTSVFDNYPLTSDNGVWVHYVMCYDGLKYYIYKNGSLVTSANANKQNIRAEMTVLYLFGGTSGRYSNHSLNDVRVYDECLSAKQIKLLSQGLVCHYTLGDTGGCPNLLPYSKVSTANKNLLKTNILSSWNNLSITTIDGFDAYLYPTAQSSTWFSTGYWYKNMTANTTYTYSAYIYQDSNSSYSFNFTSLGHFQVYNSSSTASDKSHEDVVSARVYSPATIPPKTWTKISITFTTNTLAGSNFQVYPRYNIGANTFNLYFRDCKLELGNKATPWLPNSSDTEYTTMGYNDTTVYDSSGYNYHGTRSGTLTVDSNTPRYSVSTQFSSGSHIYTPTINTSGFANSFTFAWWGYIVNYTGHMMWGFSNGNRLNLYMSNSGNNFYWNTGDGNNNVLGNVKPSDYKNAWHYFAMTGDGTKAKLYIDGEYVASATTYKAVNGTIIYMNGWDSSTSYNCNGKISDFRIYATTLSAEDIKALYQVGASIDKSGNMYAYEFNEV